MSKTAEDVLHAIEVHDQRVSANLQKLAENGETMLKIVRWAVVGLIVLAGGEKALAFIGAA